MARATAICILHIVESFRNYSTIEEKLYFPLAEERKKWKIFSHTPLGPGPEGLFFESHAQCLSVAVLLSAIADVYF